MILPPAGSGVFTQSGGTNTLNSFLYIGKGSTDNGVFNLSGSTLLSIGSDEYVGYGGTGSFLQSGGTNSVGRGLYLGELAGSSGTYTLSNNGKLSASDEYLGPGTVTFSQSSGTNTISGGDFYVGYGFGNGVAIYTLSGGSLSCASDENVMAAGVFIQSGGINRVDSSYKVNGLVVYGSYTLNGTGGLFAPCEMIRGIFNQSAGTNTIAGGTSSPNGLRLDTGTYNLSDAGQLSATSEYLGLGGTGTFIQSGGTNNAGSLSLGNGSGAKGVYNLNGGTLIVSSISRGSGTGTFNFGGGTLKAGGTFSTSFPMTLTGGTANVDTGIYAVTLSGQLSGSGGLNKLGSSTLTLSGANTYQGPTTVSAGTLIVADNVGSATGLGAVTVSAGATLSGSGSISGPVSIAGTLAPGGSPGILTVDNQVTFQSGSTFKAEVFGLAAGSGYDQLMTTAPVSLAGFLLLTFGPFVPTGDDILFLIDDTGTGTISGTFQYPDDAKIGTFNGFDWYITYDANDGASPSISGGNDVAVYSKLVPEPSALALLTVGLLNLLAFARRSRKHRT